MSEQLPADPWGLTPRQREVLALMAKHGHQGAAAHEIGIHKSHFQHVLYDARDRMGMRTPTQAIVAWTRFEEQHKEHA